MLRIIVRLSRASSVAKSPNLRVTGFESALPPENMINLSPMISEANETPAPIIEPSPSMQLSVTRPEQVKPRVSNLKANEAIKALRRTSGLENVQISTVRIFKI